MERTEWDNGCHKLVFEPPDIYHCYVNGPVSLDETKMTMSVLKDEVTAKVGTVYYVTHLISSLGTGAFAPAARKYVGTITPFWKATIIVGGNPIARASANIAMRAMNSLSKHPVPFRMVKTVEEAHNAINEWRAAEKAGSPLR